MPSSVIIFTNAEKSTTYALMEREDESAFATEAVKAFANPGVLRTQTLLKAALAFTGERKTRKRIPVVSAAEIWIISNAAPAFPDEKTPLPIAPRMNAGPQLLQKTRARSASSFVHSLREYASAHVIAPTGYPPISPSARAGARDADIPNSGFVIFFRYFSQKAPMSSKIKRLDTMKKGNKDGITESAQRESASLTVAETSAGCLTITQAKRKRRKTEIITPVFFLLK